MSEPKSGDCSNTFGHSHSDIIVIVSVFILLCSQASEHSDFNTNTCISYIYVETDTANRVQILEEGFCISHKANTFGKGMNPTIFPSAMDK